MSRGEDVSKTLGTWIGKAKKLAEPPQPSEIGGNLNRAERAAGARSADDAVSQLNFKIPLSLKRRIKQLALRDNITLLTMLDHMVELYETEHGKLDRK